MKEQQNVSLSTKAQIRNSFTILKFLTKKKKFLGIAKAKEITFLFTSLI